MSNVKINIANVSKVFQEGKNKVVAIQDLSIEIQEGEFAVVLGPSGCGKTTLLRLIAGLDSPSSGSIFVDSKLVNSPGPDRGMVFQAYTSLPWLSVRENIMFAERFRKSPNSKAANEKVNELIRLMGLENFQNAYPRILSGGMKQRVALARMILADPDVMLLDEPFGALDSQTRGILQEELVKLWDRLNKTIVFVTHDIEEAIFLADRIFVLSARPGYLKEAIDVRLERPRQREQRFSDTFMNLRREIMLKTRDDALRASVDLYRLMGRGKSRR